jgi:hypothetical protein
MIGGRAALESVGSDSDRVCLVGTPNPAAPTGGSYHAVWAVVEAPDVAQSGACIKFGDYSSGYGFGQGFNRWDDGPAQEYGTLIALRELLSWVVPSPSLELRGERALVSFGVDADVSTIWKRSRKGFPRYQRVSPGTDRTMYAVSGQLSLFGYEANDFGIKYRYWAGKIGEVVALSDRRDVALTARIEGYLAHKWNIPLQPGHPYATRPPVLLTGGPGLTQPSRILRPIATLANSGWTPSSGTAQGALAAVGGAVLTASTPGASACFTLG